MSSIEYRALLCKVSHGVDWSNEGETLLSLCDGLIAESTTDNIVSVASLLKELEKQNNLGIDHLDILKALLREMQKWTLKDLVKKFQTRRKSYIRLLEKITFKLDELNDVNRLIAICRPHLAEDDHEVCRIDTVRSLFTELGKKNRLGADCLETLKKILTETGKDDLLNEVLVFETEREDEDMKNRQRMEVEERNQGESLIPWPKLLSLT